MISCMLGYVAASIFSWIQIGDAVYCDSSLEGFDFADLKSHSVSAREGLCIFSSLNILVKGAFFSWAKGLCEQLQQLSLI